MGCPNADELNRLPHPARMSAMPAGPTPPTPTLDRNVHPKRLEGGRAKVGTPRAELVATVAQAEPPRNSFRAVTRHPSAVHLSIIAEIKRKSPSAGLIRPEYEGEGFSPETIARAYQDNGAAAISCLTDETFFGGHL